MLNQILAITLKELKVILRDRGAVVSLILLPIAFILVMTTALQGLFNTGSSSNPVQMLVVNQDQGQIAARVITDLGSVSGLELVQQQAGQALTRAAAEDLITARSYAIALVFPSNFSAQILSAATQSGAANTMVTFVTDPAASSQVVSPVRGMVQGYIERQAAIAQAPLRTQQGFERMAAEAPAGQASAIQAIGSAFTSQTEEKDLVGNTGVSYEVVSPAKYKAVRTPTSAEQNVPGYTIYGVFFIIQTIATSLFREKNEGTFRRLQAAPLSNLALLAGKLLPYFLINLIQIALMFTVGIVVFHINLGSNPLALVLLSVASGAAATGLGLLLASLTRTQEQAGSLGALLAIMLSALGGSMVPTFIMPQFMQALAKFTPHYWALNGFQDVIVRGLGVADILPALGILMAFAAAFWGIAIWRFKFE